MEMPLAEVLDRLSILRLKIERINEWHLKKEQDAFNLAIQEFKNKGIKIKEEWLEELYKINSKIWYLEADIRKGKENDLGLEEVGRRAIEIRNLNRERVAMKNKIIEETGIGFKDVKINHASE